MRGVVVDTVNNSIAVRVQQAGLPLPSFIDPSRVIVTAPPVAGERVDLSATPIAGDGNGALAGGDAYASIVGRSSLRCSLGFNGTDRSGNVINISAGHCNPDIESAGTGNAAAVYEINGDRAGAQLGTFQKSVLGEQDYSIIRVNDNARARFENNLVRIPGQAPIAVDGVATPVVGAPVCKSGARTGFSCGVINGVDQTVQVGDRQLTRASRPTSAPSPATPAAPSSPAAWPSASPAPPRSPTSPSARSRTSSAPSPATPPSCSPSP